MQRVKHISPQSVCECVSNMHFLVLHVSTENHHRKIFHTDMTLMYMSGYEDIK